MSYILDALRRAEADRERERGQVPGLHTQAHPASDAAARTATRRWAPWALGAGSAALLLAGIWAGSWWASGTRATDSPAPLNGPAPSPSIGTAVTTATTATTVMAGTTGPAQAVQLAQPAQPAQITPDRTALGPGNRPANGPANGPRDGPSNGPAMAPRATPELMPGSGAPAIVAGTPSSRSAPTATPTTGESSAHQGSSTPVASIAPTAPTAPTTAATPEYAARQTPTPSTPPTAAAAATKTPPAATADALARIPRLADLPESTRRELPRLTISGSVYSADPAGSFAIINGEVTREGARLGPDLVLEQIRPRELVFRFKGERYRQPV